MYLTDVNESPYWAQNKKDADNENIDGVNMKENSENPTLEEDETLIALDMDLGDYDNWGGLNTKDVTIPRMN